MKLEDLVSISQLSDFLSGTQAVAFTVLCGKDSCYQWIQGELVKFHVSGGVNLPLMYSSTY